MKKDDHNKDKKSPVDKIIMGAIIGTAIGSAIGVGMAPKKGEETREVIRDKAKDISNEVKEVGNLTKETTSGFFRLGKVILRKLVNRKTDTAHDMRAIPTEPEIIPPEYVDRD